MNGVVGVVRSAPKAGALLALTELRRGINATKWHERGTVVDESQGVPLAMITSQGKPCAVVVSEAAGSQNALVPILRSFPRIENHDKP